MSWMVGLSAALAVGLVDLVRHRRDVGRLIDEAQRALRTAR